ncbi:hypothetical protein B0H13DRAFT_2371804 [Mycena leptocephala]|nr:hypothetical protein B0H13DRAFT_2371804 [Mycena leptocephala]
MPFVLGASTNLVLTAFTAGRILWIWHATSHVGFNKPLRNRYNTAIKVIIESGVIYSTAAIFLAITTLVDNSLYYVGTAATQQLVNIIPTFTLVYVGLKNAVHG